MKCEICGCEYEVSKYADCPQCDGLVECCTCGEWVDDATTVEGHEYCDDCFNDNFVVCGNCGKTVYNDDAREVPSGEWYCESCFDDDCTECDRCGKTIWRDDAEETPSGDIYCETCFNRHCCNCHSCGDLIWNDDSYDSPYGNPYCESCFHEYCFTCDDCGNTFWTDDMVSTDCGCYCHECAPNEDFDACEFSPNGSFERIGSRRRFGVEIETDDCDDYLQLKGDIPFDAKYDGSINGKEFASAILSSDAGLEAIDFLCDFARRHYWTTDRRCGLHIHLDASDESNESLKAIALAYYLTCNVWAAFVNPDRPSNHYCGRIAYNMGAIAEIEDFMSFARYQNRYEWINIAAYAKHGTFEIRLHEGTIDAEAICNWVRIHAIFMDWASGKTFNEVKKVFFTMGVAEKFDFIARLCQEAGCLDLIDYYLDKAARKNNCDWAKESVFAPATV